MENINAIEDKNVEATTSVQYIVVQIGNEQYGIDIKYIENIVRSQKITRVPKAQPYFRGVINLRGEICPIMSMRIKLALEPDVITDKTRFIIVKVDGASIGVIVDQVKEVVTLEEENIEHVDKTTNSDAITNYINAIGKKDGQLISLLDIVSLVVENN
ncbi:MAG: chemotaxis protein CheW [Clostridia bacterium]|nr:chemotaxis protein CheW [Clostridia bacterium]MDY4742272.1 chemotaxis protein CheW [Lachnospira sp.]